MIRRNSPKVLHRALLSAKAGAVAVSAKNVRAQIPVGRSTVDIGKFAASNTLPQEKHLRKQRGVHIFGGALNPKGIPTYQTSKYGSSSEPGVFASGRRAKPTGFGRSVGVNTPKVGTKQAVKHRNGTAFWHHYGSPQKKRA